MVTVHRAFGYRFMIFANDHSPPHLHVFGPQGEAKVVLGEAGGAVLDRAAGIGRADLRRIMAEIRRERTRLLVEWNRLHG